MEELLVKEEKRKEEKEEEKEDRKGWPDEHQQYLSIFFLFLFFINILRGVIIYFIFNCF
jgi:hypothetical protein